MKVVATINILQQLIDAPAGAGRLTDMGGIASVNTEIQPIRMIMCELLYEISREAVRTCDWIAPRSTQSGQDYKNVKRSFTLRLTIKS